MILVGEMFFPTIGLAFLHLEQNGMKPQQSEGLRIRRHWGTRVGAGRENVFPYHCVFSVAKITIRVGTHHSLLPHKIVGARSTKDNVFGDGTGLTS